MTIERIKELYEQMEISTTPTIDEIRNAIRIVTTFDFEYGRALQCNDEYLDYKDYYEDSDNFYQVNYLCDIATKQVSEFGFYITPKVKTSGFKKIYSEVKLIPRSW